MSGLRGWVVRTSAWVVAVAGTVPVTLQSACESTTPAVAPGPLPAKTLLEFFRSRGVLVMPDGERETYTKVLTGLLELQADPSCGFGSPAGSIGSLTTGTIESWQIRLPQDHGVFCGQSPAPAECEAIFDRCASFEGAVFCDDRFVIRALAVANITFTHMTMMGLGLLGSVRPDPKNPRQLPKGTDAESIADRARLTGLQTGELTDILKLAIDLRHTDDSASVPRGATLFEAPNVVTSDWILDVLIGFVLAHEFAHLEQHACPSTIHAPWESVMSAYSSFVCESTSREEMEADLQGASLVQELLSRIRSQTDVPTELKNIDNDQSLVTKRELRAGFPFQ